MKQTITSLFIVFFGITCVYHKTFAQSPAKTVSEFTAFLEHFEQIFPGDTLTDITQSLFITDHGIQTEFRARWMIELYLIRLRCHPFSKHARPPE